MATIDSENSRQRLFSLHCDALFSCLRQKHRGYPSYGRDGHNDHTRAGAVSIREPLTPLSTIHNLVTSWLNCQGYVEPNGPATRSRLAKCPAVFTTEGRFV